MRSLFLLFFFAVIHLQVVSQTHTYSISTGDHMIGELTVSKSQDKDITHVKAVSKVSINLFINIHLEYKLDCFFRNDTLINSTVTTYVNGDIHSSSKIKKASYGYLVNDNGHESHYYKIIEYSGALLYFNEPKNKERIFSEFDMVEKLIRKIDTNQYQIINPDNGQKAEYFYSNEILEKAVIHHKILTFTIKKQV